MIKDKIKDIIETMIEYNLIDSKRAMIDEDYLVESVFMYIEAANKAREIMHMDPLV